MLSSPLRPDLLSLEISGAAAIITLTQGAINIWLGRNLDHLLLTRILNVISRVDPAAEHEREVYCPFDEISDFEGNGYILTSYARKGDRYRAIFVVPLSRESALERFVLSIVEELQREDVRISLRWRGGFARMRDLCQELQRLNYFTLYNPIYREEQRSKED